jgi:hypothetical protein
MRWANNKMKRRLDEFEGRKVIPLQVVANRNMEGARDRRISPRSIANPLSPTSELVNGCAMCENFLVSNQ